MQVTIDQVNSVFWRCEAFVVRHVKRVEEVAKTALRYVAAGFEKAHDFVRPRNPVTKDRQFWIIPESVENSMGIMAYDTVCLNKLKGHAELKSKVEEVFNRLKDVCDRPDLDFEIKIIDTDEVNAVCLPGGKIAIYMGLLKELKSEEELAAVLAHEMVHACARHGGRKVQLATLLSTGSWALALLLNRNVEDENEKQARSKIIRGTMGVGGHFVKCAHGRGNELDADRYGMHYMAKAGFNPRGAIVMMSILKNHEGDVKGCELLRTHPYSKKRLIANIKTFHELKKEYPNICSKRFTPLLEI